jgi:hypothetical protein
MKIKSIKWVLFTSLAMISVLAHSQDEDNLSLELKSQDWFNNRTIEITKVFFKYEAKKGSNVKNYMGNSDNNNFNWSVNIEKKIRIAITDSLIQNGLTLKTHHKNAILQCVLNSFQNGKIKKRTKLSGQFIKKSQNIDTVYFQLSFNEFYKGNIAEISYSSKFELLNKTISLSLCEIKEAKYSNIELTIPSYFTYQISVSNVDLSKVRKAEKELFENLTIGKFVHTPGVSPNLDFKNVKLSFRQDVVTYLIEPLEKLQGSINLQLISIDKVIVE